MWLLHVINGSFSLNERSEDDIPPYAILSHTWGADEEEVIYRDLVEGTGHDKTGYLKLEFCRRQAEKDGLEYFWIDTCCIDKSSSSELTEAINSMFRWYQHSKKCYVYLSDVVLGTVAEAQSLPLDVVQQSLSESRWFSRGWTLQELLAPDIVEFFSSEGRLIGTKKSLETIIHEITGINEEVLQGKPLSQVSIQDRLSWANERETKRDEDESYALMGLFGIHMPTIYGEGRENARRRLLNHIQQQWTIQLPIAEGASFNSHLQEHSARCLPETRVDLLDDLTTWAKSIDSKPIFWLNGMAGTGKSTIARTLASSFAEQGHLGASFFFKSSEAQLSNARRFFSTIAAGLAENIPETIPGMLESIKKDPTIYNRPLSVQFEGLILRPLQSVKSASEANVLKIIIVIDALDECGQDEDTREILRLLPRVKILRTVSLRVFLTSRPELPIRLGFRKMSPVDYDNMILHNISPNVVQHDIEVFVRHELALVREQRSLQEDWPASHQIRELVELASPLFIFAATACRYIGETKHNPQRRLELMIRHREVQSSKLDATYIPIMNLLFEEEDEEDKEYWVSEFRAIVGSIVLLVQPLSVNAVSELIGKSKFDVGCRLDALHSVLSVPEDPESPVRLLHLSFRDFLVDPKKQGKSPLWIDEHKTHEELALRCISLMCGPKGLRTNISNFLEPVEWLRDEMKRSISTSSLPPEYAYACRCWAEHLVLSKTVIHESSAACVFLRKHFLHWLGALNVLEQGTEALVLLQDLQMNCTVAGSPIYDFIGGAVRLLSRFPDTFSRMPPQLYKSALLFSPADCIIRSTFASHLANSVDSEVKNGGLFDPINEIKFAPDGQLVAYISTYQLRVWNFATGRCIFSHDGFWAAKTVIQWAPDARQLACVCYDGSIQLVDLLTARLLKFSSGHDLPVTCLQFSENGKFLMSVSGHKTIRIWNTSYGFGEATFIGHGSAVTGAVFSKNSSMVAWGYADGTVVVWDLNPAMCRAELFTHRDIVTSVTFSGDNRLVASCSRDKTVKIWGIDTSCCLRTIVHGAQPITAAFGRGDQILATAAYDNTIRVWGIEQDFYCALPDNGAYAPWYITSLSFSNGQRLETNHGHFLVPSSETALQRLRQDTLFATSRWIVHKGQPILGLPLEFEPLCSAAHENTICLGHRSGSWTLLRFDDDGTLTRHWSFVGGRRRA
ncbi:vegetative incompatibility protein HET-E-1 [Paraphoma chrysanthemicola]|uniref:Vegetative incompatibility protein HET-E-1 n=1 Tax=Paraphoma chrysanthemicola TaxID=798071 RepID=A0A8K0VXM7_9PLEO|nr:vegetative incompatibility protein HET-E-1 [Paraphoma chrysanthemicola]